MMGGWSNEREVSLHSGAAIAQGLRQTGYNVREIDIQKRDFDLPAGTEAVFIALHGEFGEDGQIQSIMEKKGVPYTGAGPLSSKQAFDKVITKKLLVKQHISTPRYEILRSCQERTLPLPVIVKPVRQGSSFGVHKVVDEHEWQEACKDALTFNNEVIVEDYIEGREITVGIVADDVLPVIEIRAPNNNYDYRAKYTKGVTEYFVPAPITNSETETCQRLAEQTYKVLQCRGMGRVDMRMTMDGNPFVLELNTIPGFTETSLLPKAARLAGCDFPSLCNRILQLAAIC